MKKILIKELTLRNFKKSREFTFTPDAELTSIHGENKSGKTTLATAFTWLLWGKDLVDRKDFNIKTLDENNNAIPKLEHEVSCIIKIDGIQVTMKRVYSEKWVKTRGSETAELSGHETNFFWNDVPLKLAEFTKKVEETFGDETIFKTLTNPLFFNSLHWEKRRAILIDIVGDISDAEIVSSDLKFQELIDQLTGKSMKEFEAQIKGQKKKIKDRLDVIPSLINENDRMTPEEPDYEFVKSEIGKKELEISDINAAIKDKSKLTESYFQKREEWLNNLNKIKWDIGKLEETARNQSQEASNHHSTKIYDLKKEIQKLEHDIDSKKLNLSQNDKRAESIKIEQDQLRTKFKEEQESVLLFDEKQFTCPSCKRPYESDDIEKSKNVITANFNEEKARKLTEIRTKGFSFTSRMDEIKQENETIYGAIEVSELQLKEWKENLLVLESKQVNTQSVESILAVNPDYQELLRRKKYLNENPIEQPKQADITEQESEKRRLNIIIDELKSKLSIKTQIEKLEARKAELEAEEKTLAQELSVLEKYEFLIEKFTRVKVDALETRVNRLFPTVKFRLFETQLNGGLKECCDSLINGVPFAAANSAAQIQVGIEIINILHEKYGIILPIWNDNAESTTEIPRTKAQVIRLFVDPSFNILTIK